MLVNPLCIFFSLQSETWIFCPRKVLLQKQRHPPDSAPGGAVPHFVRIGPLLLHILSYALVTFSAEAKASSQPSAGPLLLLILSRFRFRVKQNTKICLLNRLEIVQSLDFFNGKPCVLRYFLDGSLATRQHLLGYNNRFFLFRFLICFHIYFLTCFLICFLI